MCKAVLMALLPIVCCLVYCGMQGKSIGDVYLPASEWNDELYYFKQVEGIIRFGYPQGYFGFNESHALKLSFAAWSPILVFPWILWGLLFGWNLLSPIICNILLLTLAVFLFVWLVKPTWKQLGILALLFCFYTPFVRYMLSGMPEIICFSMLILFYGLAVNYLEWEKGYKLVLLFVISGLLTLMRPYMILFLLLPVFLWWRRSRWKGLAGSAVVIAIVGVIYILINHYLGAEYFTPLFFTDWITTFFTDGFGAGVRHFFAKLYSMGRIFLSHTKQGFLSGLASGAFFGGYLAMMAVLLWQSFVDWRKVCACRAGNREENQSVPGQQTRLIIQIHLAFSFVAMLFALLLMYKITEGSKHLLTFIAVGIFVVSLMETKFFKKAVLLAAVFAYLYSYMAVDPYDYQVPFADQGKVAQIEDWRELFSADLELKREHVPDYENVVIWVFSDSTPEGAVITKWQVLYGLPEGFGISCCMPDYVIEHMDTLQSRYIATVSGGTIDSMCQDAGYREMGRDEDIVFYERQ